MAHILEQVGFVNVKVTRKPESREVIKRWLPGSGAEDFVVAANIEASKPNDKGTASKEIDEAIEDLPLCLM